MLNNIKYFKNLFAITLFLFIFNCVFIQKKLDEIGINDIKNEILSDFQPGDPNKLKEFINNFSLNKYSSSSPINYKKIIKIKKLKKWHLKDSHLNYEKWIFPSEFDYNARTNKAIFYVIKKQSLKKSKVILWVPGKGVSDFAFNFIKKFFKIELKYNYNIVIYIPAYHLERTEIGKKSGEGFFGASILNNTENILKSSKELNMVIKYLKSIKVKSISGWAGSMGVPMLILGNHNNIKFEHLVLMIPVLNFNTVFMHKNFKELLGKYNGYGFPIQIIKSANDLISPIHYKLFVNSNNIQILYGKYDQLNPVSTIKKFARDNKVINIIGYNLSHATILLSKKMYTDYDKFLKKIQTK